MVEVGTKEVVIPTTPSVEAPVKSDVLVNKMVPDPQHLRGLEESTSKYPNANSSSCGKKRFVEAVNSHKQLPETGVESALGLALLGAILGAAGMEWKKKRWDLVDLKQVEVGSGTEIGNSLEFDFVVPFHSWVGTVCWWNQRVEPTQPLRLNSTIRIERLGTFVPASFFLVIKNCTRTVWFFTLVTPSISC